VDYATRTVMSAALPREAVGLDRRRAAYLVMSHTRPQQVVRLVRTLRTLSPEAAIVVHHDQRVTRLGTAEVIAVGADVLLSPQQRIRWGDISQVDALLRALRWLEGHVEYDWVVHMSGQDYPVRPLREYEARLRDGAAEAYLRYARVGTEADVAGRWQEEAVRRYFYHYRPVPAVLARALLRARHHHRLADRASRSRKQTTGVGRSSMAAAGSAGRRPWFVAKMIPGDGRVRVGFPARRTPFTDGYCCYKGSYWVTLSRPAVRRLLDVRNLRPELYQHFARTSNPDEAYVATLLANDESIRLLPDDFRYLDWTQRTPHPDVLTSADLERVMRSGRFLARKFDAGIDPGVLSAIDALLGICPEKTS
jgi:Core-2/I-Branching enzyme